jgi:thioredoxin reductase
LILLGFSRFARGFKSLLLHQFFQGAIAAGAEFKMTELSHLDQNQGIWRRRARHDSTVEAVVVILATGGHVKMSGVPVVGAALWQECTPVHKLLRFLAQFVLREGE